MEKFIKKTAFFLFIPLLSCVALLVILQFANDAIKTSERLDPSITTLFTGDSHIAQAINDTLLKNSINMAQTSEALYFSYYKLQTLIQHNPSIKTVCLGFSAHSISSYYDKFIDGEYSNAISSRYFYLLPIKEKLQILHANRNAIFSYLKVIIKNGIRNALTNKKTFEGEFENYYFNQKINKASINKRIVFQYYNKNRLNDFSLKNIEYLEKIKGLCAKSKVKLILINTPVHSSYKDEIPQKFKLKFKQLPASLRIEMLDLSNLFTKEFLFVPDGDHVSQKGAIKTTEYIAQKLKL